MNKIKKIIKIIADWFKVKYKNRGLKKYIKQLEEKIINLESEIIKLEDLTDKSLNVQRVKDLRVSLEHEREIKRSLRIENKDLRERIKKLETR